MAAPDSASRLQSWRRWFWAAGAVFAAAAAAGGVADPDQFFRSYLYAFFFWISLPLGTLVFALIAPLVGGAWVQVIRTALIGCVGTMPFAALAFVPVVLGVRRLYAWAGPRTVADPRLASVHAYLSPLFFTVRGIVYFSVWLLLAALLIRDRWPWSKAALASGRLRGICAAGLVLHVTLGTFAAVDWGLSLESGYASTNYGFIFLASQTLVALAFVVAATALLQGRGLIPIPVLSKATPKAIRDVGSLLAMNVLLWAYLQYSQLIVNWSGDTKRDMPWYLHRSTGGWAKVAAVLIALHFAVPFFVLLLRRVKRVLSRLGWVGLGLVSVHVLAVFWFVVPSFGHGLGVHWLDAATWLALGGLWLGTFAWRIEGRPEAPRSSLEAKA